MSLHVHFLSLSICLFPVLTASDIKLLHADALAILSAAENKLPAIGNDIMSHSYQCYMWAEPATQFHCINDRNWNKNSPSTPVKMGKMTTWAVKNVRTSSLETK